MPDKVEIFIDPDSCLYFRIDPEEYKGALHLAFNGMTHDITIIINHRHSVFDGIFPLGISMFTETSKNQQSKTLAEVQLAVSSVFQVLAANAQPGGQLGPCA